MKSDIFRPTWAEISSRAFSSNLRECKKFVGSHVQILAVLKADAYGHGAAALAPLAIREGASTIGVSSLEEAISLRESGVSFPILILGGIYPLHNFEVALEHNLIPTVASWEAAKALSRVAIEKSKAIPFHLKVDTGMGRIGVSLEEATRMLPWLTKAKEIPLAGMYSHLSSADMDARFTKRQIAEMEGLSGKVRGLGLSNVVFHIANSAGLLRFRESHFGMVRPGLALYGDSLVPLPPKLSLLPVLSWHSRVIFLKKVPKGSAISYGQTFRTRRPSLIATLPVGYADGVPRLASNTGCVLVGGKRCPIVGRVTMDQIMVDVTGMSVRVGDPAVLIGKQKGTEIRVGEWAQWAKTISYEIFCGISQRVPRILK